MTLFIVICTLMAVAGIAVVAVPLWRNRERDNTRRHFWTMGIVALLIPLAAAGLYVRFSNWSWDESARAQTGGLDINAMVAQLEQKLKEDPQNIDGWLMLGRSYVSTSRFALAVDAYQHAYDLTQGKNIDAITGLAEALILVDESSLTGKAGQLIDQALVLQPDSPKALWYGGLAALRGENLKLARDRFKSLLAMNPPEQVRNVLEREVQDLDQQLGEQASPAPTAQAAQSAQRSVEVEVTLAPELKQKLSEPLALFVLAREAGKGGVPLAVVRRGSNDLPLKIALTEADAMLPARTLMSADQVEIVARLSKSGAPTEQPGDYFGAADYSFAQQGAHGAVKIRIDRIAP